MSPISDQRSKARETSEALVQNGDQSWGCQEVTQEGASGPSDRDQLGLGSLGACHSPTGVRLIYHNFTGQQLVTKSPVYSVLEICLHDSKCKQNGQWFSFNILSNQKSGNPLTTQQ